MRAIEQAASLLNVSEYRLFNEAHLAWFGDRAEQNDVVQLFALFKMYGEVPHWADNYAKTVIDDIEANRYVSLNSFCLVNLAPRTEDKPDITFSILP